MAAKKKDTGDALAGELEALFGGNDEEATVKQFLTTGYAELNYALSSRYGGGLPVGRIVEIAGPPSSGKTAIATEAMAQAMREGGIGAFMDHERSFSKSLAIASEPLFASSRFIYKKPETFEASLELCTKVCMWLRENKKIAPEAPICWVFDSLASMAPHSTLYDAKGNRRPLDTQTMNDMSALSRVTSTTFRTFTLFVEELNICAIFLNQVRTKIGVVYGDPRTTPGGDAPKFYASVRIMLNTASKIVKKGVDAPIGMEISAAVIKNKVSRPFLKANWRFEFRADGTGKFALARSTIDFLLKTGQLTEVRKGFIEWDGVQRSREALAELIEKNGEMHRLLALLPADYEPEVVTESELEGDLEADPIALAA